LVQALELAETEALDAAILDLNINGGRSYVVADELRRRGVPYMFATGYGADGIEARDASALVLTKPYRQEHVEAALLDLLNS
jgi:DNA-binding response OmpR family regulator